MPEIMPDDTDYSGYIDSAMSPTMVEFIEWLHEFVPYKKWDDKSAYLAVRLYGYFQRSESHQNVLEERRAAKEAGEEPEPEPEPEPVKAAPKGRRGKPAAAVAAEPEPEPVKAAPKRRGRPAAVAAEPEPEPEAPARPVRRGRGRPVADGATAPY
jgi:hypothetical protein